MAKEGELKKTDLKVSINCCEGCKRKVKKVLQSIDGVYKVQIDAFESKVTVIGNVDSQTLIKKLAKGGKAVEAWPNESKKPVKEEKKADNTGKGVEISTKNAKDKAKDTDAGKATDNKECKCSTCSISTEIKGNESSGTAGGEKKDDEVSKNGTSNSGSSVSADIKGVNPVPRPGIVHEAVNVVPYGPCYYPVKPPVVLPSYYTVGPYSAAPSCYLYELPVSHAPVPSTAWRITEYFNDENTNGCSVM